jgi:hypothetical protein
MAIQRLLVTSAIILALSVSASYAGPCSQEIDRMQAKFDAKLEARAAVAPSAPESPAATAHHQPTPNSIAGAEAELGVLSPKQVTAVTEALGRAREADRVGDQSACEQALSVAQHTLGE